MKMDHSDNTHQTVKGRKLSTVSSIRTERDFQVGYGQCAPIHLIIEAEQLFATTTYHDTALQYTSDTSENKASKPVTTDLNKVPGAVPECAGMCGIAFAPARKPSSTIKASKPVTTDLNKVPGAVPECAGMCGIAFAPARKPSSTIKASKPVTTDLNKVPSAVPECAGIASSPAIFHSRSRTSTGSFNDRETSLVRPETVRCQSYSVTAAIRSFRSIGAKSYHLGY